MDDYNEKDAYPKKFGSPEAEHDFHCSCDFGILECE